MADIDEKVVLPTHYYNTERPRRIPAGFRPSGVARVEAIAASATLRNRVCIFLGIFLVSLAYGLDSSLRPNYQTVVTTNPLSFGSSPLTSSIGVATSVISVVILPGAAKIADIFGRNEVLIASVFFYVVGTVIEASANDVTTFAVGAVIYQIGYSLGWLVVILIVADTTSLRSRVLFSYIPDICSVIIPWITSDIASAVIKKSTWRWGIGMWAIIYAGCASLLITLLFWISHKAKKAGNLNGCRTPYQLHGGWTLTKVLFWQLDVIGIVLLTTVLVLILTPLNLAGGNPDQTHGNWTEAKIIAPLAVGVLSIPAFVWWETKAPIPMIPIYLLKDRTVLGALGIAVHLNFVWSCQGNYLSNVLIVAFNEGVTATTVITNLYSCVSVATGILFGLVIYKVRYLKPFIMLGTFLYLISLCLLLHYRGGITDSAHAGIIAAQVVLGIGAGLVPTPILASIQAATKHEHLAIVIGLFFAFYGIGSSLGGVVAGAIWTQVLPSELEKRIGNKTLAEAWYNIPEELVLHYRPGTPERDPVMEAYEHVQRLLCITGACLCVPLIFFSFIIRNPRLSDTQSLENEEEDEVILMADLNETPDMVGHENTKSWVS